VDQEVMLMGTRATSAKLDAFKSRVDEWRRQRGKRTRIPEELWDEAVRVAETDGLWATSKAARFHYPDLKERLEKARHRPAQGLTGITGPLRGRPGSPQDHGRARADAEAFVEVPMSVSDAAARTVVELVGSGGDRMRVEAAGGVDLAGLARAFFGRDAR
jgi:hypothetical protein